MNIKNLKVVAAGLCLGATLLTWCSDKITQISIDLKIEDNKLECNISYKN